MEQDVSIPTLRTKVSKALRLLLSDESTGQRQAVAERRPRVDDKVGRLQRRQDARRDHTAELLRELRLLRQTLLQSMFIGSQYPNRDLKLDANELLDEDNAEGGAHLKRGEISQQAKVVAGCIGVTIFGGKFNFFSSVSRCRFPYLQTHCPQHCDHVPTCNEDIANKVLLTLCAIGCLAAEMLFSCFMCCLCQLTSWLRCKSSNSRSCNMTFDPNLFAGGGIQSKTIPSIHSKSF